MRKTSRSPFSRNPKNHDFNIQMKHAHSDDNFINPVFPKKGRSAYEYTLKTQQIRDLQIDDRKQRFFLRNYFSHG